MQKYTLLLVTALAALLVLLGSSFAQEWMDGESTETNRYTTNPVAIGQAVKIHVRGVGPGGASVWSEESDPVLRVFQGWPLDKPVAGWEGGLILQAQPTYEWTPSSGNCNGYEVQYQIWNPSVGGCSSPERPVLSTE